jgi:hypothetical protein
VAQRTPAGRRPAVGQPHGSGATARASAGTTHYADNSGPEGTKDTEGSGGTEGNNGVEGDGGGGMLGMRGKDYCNGSMWEVVVTVGHVGKGLGLRYKTDMFLS